MTIAERPADPIRIALLGSGGSIGRQAVDVLLGLGDAVRCVALATGHQAELLEAQARQLRPLVVALPGDPGAAARLDLPVGTDVESASNAGCISAPQTGSTRPATPARASGRWSRSEPRA